MGRPIETSEIRLSPSVLMVFSHLFILGMSAELGVDGGVKLTQDVLLWAFNTR